MSRFKMPTAYHPSNAEWVRPIESLTSDGVRELQRLRAENAKLRMLIDLKQTCWKYVGWCSECPYNGLDDEHDGCNCTVREKVNSLARELGIEVDW